MELYKLFKYEEYGNSEGIRIWLPHNKSHTTLSFMSEIRSNKTIFNQVIFYLLRTQSTKRVIDCEELIKTNTFKQIINEMYDIKYKTANEKYNEFISRCKLINNIDLLFIKSSYGYLDSVSSTFASFDAKKWYLSFIKINLNLEEMTTFASEAVEAGILKKTSGSIDQAAYALYRLSIQSLNSLDKTDNTVFVISEFNDRNQKTYSDLIKPTIELNNMKSIIMYDDHLHGNIDIAIKNYIKKSKFVIANLSYEKSWNPNVFYEIGLAKAYEKPIILILDEEIFDRNEQLNLPFDINSHTCIKIKKGTENNVFKKAVDSLT